nr:hypothetical protein [Tanacetum cinerariifolium]
MLLAMKDEARSNLDAEENDFMLDNSFGGETLEELVAAVITMARIQPADDNVVTEPTYNAKAVSEVNASHKAHEQVNHVKRKTIIHASDDDQIDSNIIIDNPYVENNGGISEHDSTDHDEYDNIQILAYNIQRELAKKAYKERENRYLDDIVVLEEKLSSHDRIVYKMGQSIETIYVLGKTPNKVYDPFLKAGLGYQNPERLKKFIAAQPKMYHGQMLYNTKLKIISHDSEETLEDAEESRLKMRKKMTELEKSSSDSKDIQANLLKRITILENDFKRSQAQSIDFELKLQQQKEKMACVESSNSVRRPKSKDTKSKNRVLKNTNDKGSYVHVRKVSSSVCVDSNKRETMNSTIWQSNESVLKIKTVNAVNDGLNIFCVSCGQDVFMLSHEKCVAHYALSRDSRIKRALFTCPVAAKSKNLGATSVVVKSRLSVPKTLTTTNKVIQLVLWIVDSGCSKNMTGNMSLLRNFVEKFIGTVRFENDRFTAITGYGDYVQGNLTICHGDDLLTGSRKSNLCTISIFEFAASSLECLMFKTTSTKSWLWHRRLSHLTFDSLEELKEIPLQQDLDNLFVPLYEEYYASSTLKVSNNSVANTLDEEDTSLPSLIIVEDSDAPQIVNSLEEPTTQESSNPVLETQSDEQIQEDNAKLDGNTIMHSFEILEFREAESSLNYQDPSNMHEFHR